MGFQKKQSSYKQVILTSKHALEPTRLPAFSTASHRPTPLENQGGFSHVIVMLCGRKNEAEKSSIHLMVLVDLALAILLAFRLAELWRNGFSSHLPPESSIFILILYVNK